MFQLNVIGDNDDVETYVT